MSEFGTHETVSARIWPWLDLFSVQQTFKPLKLSLSRSAAVLSNDAVSNLWSVSDETRVWHGSRGVLNPNPDPKPFILTPEPQTLDPHPNPWTLNPKP